MKDETEPRTGSGDGEARTRPASSFEGEYGPGHVLIGRYRIVALIGEGGMGQVYLADDLVLGQPVAVKFLPEHVAEHEDGLERFRDEVRHAREVTHPNVARVHDIGEVEGRHFLTMEFVDGEDLSSLIKRIGRLPREKASQIAQQICSALAEAHRKGVLHRDLKPANVMLDGEGQVRLTDFGLAVAAEASSEAHLAGTPPYMAPEQLAGVPASVQSEIYSLGLLLYELYTGKRALRGRTLDELRREHEEGGPDPPSSQLADIDPDVEAVLTHCLARDPKERPESVRAVAHALPGGDPLAAALAAGETPAPEVVAAAEAQGALAPRTALLLLLGAALLFVGGTHRMTKLAEEAGVSYGKPPEVLRERARNLATRLTGESFAHEIHWYMVDPGVRAAAEPRDEGAEVDRPAWSALLHHSRFGNDPFLTSGLFVSATDPAPVAGSAHVVLEANGNLIAWNYRVDADTGPSSSQVAPDGGLDWNELLEQTGFTLDEVDADPRHVPGVFATDHRAWVPVEAIDGERDELRIEAAAFQGRPVLLETFHGDTRLGFFTPPPTLVGAERAFFTLLLTGLGAILAWHNVKRGRADVRGALKVGLFAFATHAIVTFAFDMPDDLMAYGSRLYLAMGYPLHIAVRVAIFYLALEPIARKRWPQRLVSWNRLLEGRLRDASVGREILLGLVALPAAQVLGGIAVLVMQVVGLDLDLGSPRQNFLGIESPFQTLIWVLHGAGDAVMYSGMLVLVLVLLRWMVRIPWVANVLFLGFMAVFDPNTPVVWLLTSGVVILFLLTRVGFLSLVAMWFVLEVVNYAAFTFRPDDWYFPASLAALSSLLVVGIWAYRAAVGGRSLFPR